MTYQEIYAVAEDHFNVYETTIYANSENGSVEITPELFAFAHALLAQAVPKWEPIESAPKGLNVLLYGSKRANIFIGNWSDFDGVNEPKVTLWAPLPAAPAAESNANLLLREDGYLNKPTK